MLNIVLYDIVEIECCTRIIRLQRQVNKKLENNIQYRYIYKDLTANSGVVGLPQFCWGWFLILWAIDAFYEYVKGCFAIPELSRVQKTIDLTENKLETLYSIPFNNICNKRENGWRTQKIKRVFSGLLTLDELSLVV